MNFADTLLVCNKHLQKLLQPPNTNRRAAVCLVFTASSLMFLAISASFLTSLLSLAKRDNIVRGSSGRGDDTRPETCR